MGNRLRAEKDSFDRDVSRKIRKYAEQLSNQKSDKFWDVEWNGYVFDIRPFLPQCFNCCNWANKYDWLVKAVISSTAFTDPPENHITIWEQLQNTWGIDLIQAASAMYIKTDDHPVLDMLIVLSKDYDVSRFSACSFIIAELYLYLYGSSKRPNPVEFKDKDVANIQAFCYYISLYWLLKKSNALQIEFAPVIRKFSFKRSLLELCVEGSPLRKFVSGEVTGTEFAELMYNWTESGSEMYRYIRNISCTESDKDLLQQMFINTSGIQALEMRLIGMYGFHVSCSDLLTEAGNALSECKKHIEENNKLLEELKQSAEDVHSARKEIDDTQKANARLNERCEKQQAELVQARARIAELERQLRGRSDSEEVKSLKSDVRELSNALDLKESELLDTKIRLRKALKGIKSLKSCIPQEEVAAVECIEKSSEEDNVPIEEMIVALRGMRIMIVYSANHLQLQDTAIENGLDVILYGDNVGRFVPNADLIVIYSRIVSHKAVRRVQKDFDRSKIVYINGSSFENFIKVCYEYKLSKEV